MPRELRTILFSEFEVVDALRRYVEASGWDLGGETIDRVTAFDETPVRVVAQCSGEGARRLTLNAIDLTRALLLYCLERKIPIPRRGEKDVRIVEGAMALLVELRS